MASKKDDMAQKTKTKLINKWDVVYQNFNNDTLNITKIIYTKINIHVL